MNIFFLLFHFFFFISVLLNIVVMMVFGRLIWLMLMICLRSFCDTLIAVFLYFIFFNIHNVVDSLGIEVLCLLCILIYHRGQYIATLSIHSA